MKIFVSWSGVRGKYVAEALREWLPYVIHSIEPWMSSTDIAPGARWNSEIAKQLEETQFGVICLTKESALSPWILFEAGALAKSIDKTFVCPYLIDLNPTDVEGPLAQFQALKAEKEDTWRLVLSIHKAMQNTQLTEIRLHRTFEKFWPDLKKALEEIPTLPHDKIISRTDRSLLEEILEVSRSLSRSINSQGNIPKRNQSIIVDVSSVDNYNDNNKEVVWPISSKESIQDLLDEIYVNFLYDTVEAYTYDEKWILRNLSTGEEYHKDMVDDRRLLRDIGIYPGARLKIALLGDSSHIA
jgi:hypothetical protein